MHWIIKYSPILNGFSRIIPPTVWFLTDRVFGIKYRGEEIKHKRTANVTSEGQSRGIVDVI